MKNIGIKTLSAVIVALIVQLSCERSYPASMPTPILADVPKLLVRGQEYKFTVQTTPGVECHAGIGYYNNNDKWVTTDLSTIQSDKNGICEWTWEIPEDAKDGIGELRGYIQEKGQSNNLFPSTFCIETCP